MSGTSHVENGTGTGFAVLTDTEKNKILYGFNDSGWEHTSTESILSLFEQQVRNNPAHTATTFQQLSLTYQELDERSNQIAHELIRRGITPGMLVPVWVERSVTWLTAVIGVLKAGAAYIPIDPSYPVNRVAYIIADAKATVIITSSSLGKELPDPTAGVLIADTVTELSRQPVTKPDITTDMAALAYVIYTSGSTGKPKGVMITHDAIEHLVAWHNLRFGVNKTSQLTLVAGLAFDISVWEVWSALTSGATLHIASDEERMDAASVVTFFIKQHITHGFVPTVLVPSFVALTRAEMGLNLRYLFTGGELLKPVSTENLPYELIDYYGPTECTVYATCNKVQTDGGPFLSTIGKPIGNIQAYILNAQHEVLPVGATGELCLSGRGLASGYLNNPELTAEQFIPHPFLPEQKLYLTGDLAKWLPDGRIQFAGRIDNQVKIRGFRIELGEIERALIKADDNIKDVVVITRENAGNNKYLIAFIVPQQPGAMHDHSRIRQQLKEELPGYMVPAQIITIDALPVTANGKTDKGGLAAIAAQHALSVVATEPPRNETEKIIAGVWSSTLERPVINISDHFFDIGGDSLLVAVVATALTARLNVKIYMRDLYQYPVLKLLAARLTERATAAIALPEEDAEPDAALQQDVRLHPETPAFKDFDENILTSPGALLLTGATGFVGIHLLQELLDTTTADIYCLVRAGDEFQAMEKIMNCFETYKIPVKKEQQRRIIPFTGDLAMNNLGLQQAYYDILAKKIDIIYHSGSSVNFIEPYSYMKAPNVQGLQEIIKFAGTEKTKCLVLLSTISVYSWGHVFTHKTVMKETDDIAQNLLAVSKDIGYVRSKWVMEAVADLAAAKGLPLITYRLGYAMCHGETGASAPYQWWAGLVKNCIEYESYPQLRELREGLITVDYMTRAIAAISKKKDAIGRKFNLIASPETNLTLENFFGLLQQYYPYKLRGLPYKEWRKQWEDDPKNRLYPLTSLFRDNMHEGLSTVELYQDTYVWDCAQVQEFLKDTDIREPVFDKRLLDAYLHYLGIPVSQPLQEAGLLQ